MDKKQSASLPQGTCLEEVLFMLCEMNDLEALSLLLRWVKALLYVQIRREEALLFEDHLTLCLILLADDFLSKYCIISEGQANYYRRIFKTVSMMICLTPAETCLGLLHSQKAVVPETSSSCSLVDFNTKCFPFISIVWWRQGWISISRRSPWSPWKRQFKPAVGLSYKLYLPSKLSCIQRNIFI